MALNGLVLILHIKQHLRGGLGLRQILDWMMYLEANDNLDTLLPMIREMGLERLSLTVTVMCQDYLGLRTMAERDETLPCSELMEYIIAKGNFGRKGGVAGKMETVFMDLTRPKKLLQRLQIGGRKRWNAAEEHSLLARFSWMYQIGLGIGTLFRNRVSPRSVLRTEKAARKNRRLIKDLEDD